MDDKDTLEQLYREAAPALLAYFRHQPALADLAEDLLHDTFVRALGRQRRQKLTWELGKLAACVLLGLTVGLSRGLEEPPPSHRLTPRSLSACRPLTRRAPLPRDKTGFGRSPISRPGNRNTPPLP
jgi:hypothetical protein